MIQELFKLPSSKQATVILTATLIFPTGAIVLYLLNTKQFVSLDAFKFFVMCVMYVFPFVAFNFTFMVPLNKYSERFQWMENNMNKATIEPPPPDIIDESKYYVALNGALIITMVIIYLYLCGSYVIGCVFGVEKQIFQLSLRNYVMVNVIAPMALYSIGLLSAIVSRKDMVAIEERYKAQENNKIAPAD